MIRAVYPLQDNIPLPAACRQHRCNGRLLSLSVDQPDYHGLASRWPYAYPDQFSSMWKSLD